MPEPEVIDDLETEPARKPETILAAKPKPKPTATPEPRDADDDDETLGDSGKRALEAERKRAADLKRKLIDVTRKLEERERAEQEARDQELPEIERLRKLVQDNATQKAEADRKAAQAEAELVEERIGLAVERGAMGRLKTPRLARSLVERASLEYDPETKSVKGIKEELDRILKDAPELGVSGDARGGSMTRDPGGRGRATEAAREQEWNPRLELAQDGMYSV